MKPPTIDLSPDGRHFTITLNGGENTDLAHSFNVPINLGGMWALRELLQARQQAAARLEPDHIGTKHHPTQHIVDAWLRENKPATLDTKRIEEAERQLSDLGVKADDFTLEELGL